MMTKVPKVIKTSTYNIMTLAPAPDDLRRHILDGATETISSGLTTAELLRKTKVS